MTISLHLDREVRKYVNVPRTRSMLRTFVSGRRAADEEGRGVECCPYGDLAPYLREAWLAGHQSVGAVPDFSILNSARMHLKGVVVDWCEEVVIDIAGGDRAALAWLIRKQMDAAFGLRL